MWTFVLNRSVSCAEIDEFSYVELIYYKIDQPLQTDARIAKWGNFITKWCEHYFKVGQLRVITKRQEKLQSGTVNLWQSGTIVITMRDVYYKKGSFIAKWGRYYKLGPELLESGLGNLLQSGSIVIAKWGRYYKVGQLLIKKPYTFVTLGQYVYW